MRTSAVLQFVCAYMHCPACAHASVHEETNSAHVCHTGSTAGLTRLSGVSSVISGMKTDGCFSFSHHRDMRAQMTGGEMHG